MKRKQDRYRKIEKSSTVHPDLTMQLDGWTIETIHQRWNISCIGSCRLFKNSRTFENSTRCIDWFTRTQSGDRVELHIRCTRESLFRTRFVVRSGWTLNVDADRCRIRREFIALNQTNRLLSLRDKMAEFTHLRKCTREIVRCFVFAFNLTELFR